MRQAARCWKPWRRCRYVLQSPAPDVLLVGFDASSINYRARFWVDDYEVDDQARRTRCGGDLLRVRAARHRDSVSDSGRILARVAGAGSGAEQGNRERVLSRVDLFSTLSEAQRARSPHRPRWRTPSAMVKRSSGRASPASRCTCCVRAESRWAGARPAGGRRHREGRLLRRDVAPDGRAANGDGRRARGSSRPGAGCRALPAPR